MITQAALNLFPEQVIALEKINKWFGDKTTTKKQFRLGGYAGTGKTTMIRAVLAALDCDAIITAFTGKAVSVLRKKGLSAETIHSTIYDVDMNAKEPTYHLKDSLDADLVVVDEASMISGELYNDLLSFDIPVLWVGDPGQLEPIGEEINLMASPDFVLNDIHRQAEGSEILDLATFVRLQKASPAVWRMQNKPTTGESLVSILPYKGYAQIELLSQVDQIICGFNKTRIGLNKELRKLKGKTQLVEPGDKVVCLKNSQAGGIFNGQVLSVIEVGKRLYKDRILCLTLQDDLDRTIRVRCLIDQFHREKTFSLLNSRLSRKTSVLVPSTRLPSSFSTTAMLSPVTSPKVLGGTAWQSSKKSGTRSGMLLVGVTPPSPEQLINSSTSDDKTPEKGLSLVRP